MKRPICLAGLEGLGEGCSGKLMGLDEGKLETRCEA